jgi:hypothetical protein
MTECCNEDCKWRGTDDQKLKVKDKEMSESTGVNVEVLVCPVCGCDEFYED